MRHFLAAMAVLFGALLPAQGQEAAAKRPVVVELYTSQGCSSCPPADALLKKLDARPGIIALALHVDYWDYIGWKDEFGSPAHSARQRAYARHSGRRAVYTPQMIIGGQGHVVGHRPMEVIDRIEAVRAQPEEVTLQIARRADRLQVKARAVAGTRGEGAGKKRELVVQLVRYIPSQVSRITRGENAGRTIEYTNIVTEWRRLAEWDGAGTLELSAPVSGELPVVVIIQERGPGRILTAARLR